MMTISCMGHLQVARRLLTAGAAIPAVAVPSGIDKAGLLVLRRAKQNVVEKHIIDTGNLLSLVAIGERTPTSIEVVSGAEYSVYQEFGHHTRSGSWVAARPYMRPALDESHAQIEKLLGESVQKTIMASLSGG